MNTCETHRTQWEGPHECPMCVEDERDTLLSERDMLLSAIEASENDKKQYRRDAMELEQRVRELEISLRVTDEEDTHLRNLLSEENEELRAKLSRYEQAVRVEGYHSRFKHSSLLKMDRLPPDCGQRVTVIVLPQDNSTPDNIIPDNCEECGGITCHTIKCSKHSIY